MSSLPLCAPPLGGSIEGMFGSFTIIVRVTLLHVAPELQGHAFCSGNHSPLLHKFSNFTRITSRLRSNQSKLGGQNLTFENAKSFQSLRALPSAMKSSQIPCIMAPGSGDCFAWKFFRAPSQALADRTDIVDSKSQMKFVTMISSISEDEHASKPLPSVRSGGPRQSETEQQQVWKIRRHET